MIEPEKLSNVPYLDYGKQYENDAVEAFMQQEGIHHRNPKLLPSGLVISKSHPYIGGTPDNFLFFHVVTKRVWNINAHIQ